MSEPSELWTTAMLCWLSFQLAISLQSSRRSRITLGLTPLPTCSCPHQIQGFDIGLQDSAHLYFTCSFKPELCLLITTRSKSSCFGNYTSSCFYVWVHFHSYHTNTKGELFLGVRLQKTPDKGGY